MVEYERKYLTKEEVQRLLVYEAPMEDRLLIQLGLSLGCRVSEIISIRLKRIRGQVIKIWDEKKDEFRYCVIDIVTFEFLQEYLRSHYSVPQGFKREHQRIFYFGARTANRRLKKAFLDVDIPKDDVVPWRWHTLRHTYIRRMLDSMKDRGIQFICEQTGDSPATILGHYAIPSIDERVEVADKYSIIGGASVL